MKKTNYSLLSLAAALLMAGCADGYDCNLNVEKPESVVLAEQLAQLDVLKNVTDRNANPNFKLGLAVSASDYTGQGLTYSIAKTNFDFVVDESAMLHSAVVGSDGATSFVTVADMALDDAPAVVGGPMLAYNTLNKAQLENVVSANFIKGDLESGKLTLADFEGDAVGTVYDMSNGSEATVVEDPAGKSGNVLQVGSPDNKAKNSYAVLNIELPKNLTLGALLTVAFDIYCVDDNSLKKNLVMIADGSRKNFTGDTPAKRGCPTGEWGRKLIELDMAEVSLTDEQKAKSQFTLSIGPNVLNSYYYIDNVTVTWQTGVPDKYVEKTAEEKSQALADNFAAWAGSMMAACAPVMTDFTMLSDPMSDNNEFMLRSAESELACENDTAGCFFFNDYMGDNYAVTVSQCLTKAYTDNGGQGSLKLYVGESGLLENIDKADRLVRQIAQWCNAGAQIDGIAVNLPLAYSDDAAEQAQNEEKVKELFRVLAASGKLIRLDNVKMSNANADYYGYVLGQYFALVPAAQRAGIVFGGTADLWHNNARTEVYRSVVNACCASEK